MASLDAFITAIDIAEILGAVINIAFWVFFIHVGRRYLRDRYYYLNYVNTFVPDNSLSGDERELVNRYRSMTPAQQRKMHKYADKLLNPSEIQ